ncbi:MAG: hypothetical protein KBS72_05230, partial [Bacteroidales bacterium]|nr:hypothetical protein [Candidatus Cacconaster scatequi]
MKITIASSCFYPDVHPRSFRSTELAKEFARMGHNVSVVFFVNHHDFNYDEFGDKYNLSLIPVDVFSATRVADVANHRKTYAFKLKRFLIEYFIDGYFFKYSRQICNTFMRLNCIEEADLIITMSTPFSIHYGLYKYFKKRGKQC